MENLKSSIAGKIKKLNLLFSCIEEETESISKLDVDSFAETIRALYMDVLELDNFVGKTFQEQTKEKTSELIIFPADTAMIKSVEQEVHLPQGEHKEIVHHTENITSDEHRKTEISEIQTESEVMAESVTIEPETFSVQNEDVEDNISIAQKEIEENKIQTKQNIVAETVEVIEPEIHFSQEEHITKQEATAIPIVENVISPIETHNEIENNSTLTPYPENTQTELQLEEIVEKTESVVSQKSAESISVLNYLKSKNVENAAQNVFTRYGSQPQDIPKIQTVADKFTPEKSSIFETIASQSDDKSINSKLQKQTVNDLRDIIGLNDKIVFVKDLFAGNSGDYNNFLLALNDCKSSEDVEAVLQVVKQHYNWEQTVAETYANLLKYIERKFY